MSPKNITVQKIPGYQRVSLEQAIDLMSVTHPIYARKVERIIEVPPTEEEWAEYRKAEAAWEILKDSPYFYEGGPDEGAELVKPAGKREYVYAETREEWLRRGLELIQAAQK